jgi:hypothetical protein
VAAGLVQMACLIAIASVAGNAALGTQQIVEHPRMAHLAIVGLLTGERLKALKEFKDAAAFTQGHERRQYRKSGNEFYEIRCHDPKDGEKLLEVILGRW